MDYLKVWTSFREIMEPLELQEKGSLFDMMLRYAETGEEPEIFTGNERFIWPVAKRDIDMAANWNKTCRKNGSKGGRPRKQVEPEATGENPEKPNETQNNPTKPNHNLKEIKRKEKKENTIISPSEIKRFTPPTLQEVTDYCKERGNNVDPERFVDFYASKGWRVGNQPMKDWKAAVRTWEKDRPKKPVALLPAQDFHQRDYSGEQDAAMERMMNWKAGGV